MKCACEKNATSEMIARETLRCTAIAYYFRADTTKSLDITKTSTTELRRIMTMTMTTSGAARFPSKYRILIRSTQVKHRSL